MALQFKNTKIWSCTNAIQNCLQLLMVCLMACCSALSYSQQSAIKFTHLTNLDGLSQSTVTAILKDKYGFMWFGTHDGLNRYDGYSFKVYRQQPNDPGSLRRSYINALYEDRQGNLWVGTSNGALSLYDRKHDNFIQYREGDDNHDGLSQKSVTAMYEDKQNNFWVGTFWKLNLLDRKTGKSTKYGNDPKDPASISSDGITSIFEDSKNNLWIGTSAGLNLMDRTTKKFKRYLHDANAPRSISNNNIKTIIEDNRGLLYIATDDGLNLFDPATGTFSAYKHDAGNPASISDNYVVVIANAGGGKMWVGTSTTLELFDAASGKFEHNKNYLGGVASLNRNVAVMSLMQDKEGILWVGTYQGGISKYDKSLTYFDVFRNNPNDPESLSINIITSFAENAGGDIWIGTDGGALNLWNRATGTFKRFNPDPVDAQSLATWGILCLAQSKINDYLWIGTYGKCIDRYDPKTNLFKHYTKGTAPNQLNNDAVYAIMEDRRGNIWMGTNGGGANVLDQHTGLIRKYLFDPNKPGALSGDFVRCFFEDKKGNIWIGTTTGLNVLKPGDSTFTHFDQNNPSWQSDVIVSIYEDRDGNMLIGTSGGGLDIINLATKKITNLSVLNGLPDNSINCIVEDVQGYVWLSTNNGISRFNPSSKSFKNYGMLNGIQGFEFSERAGIITRSGEILMGGVNGFNAFVPGSVLENRNIPQVIITGFKLFNKPVSIGDKNSPLQAAITETKEMTLKYGQSVITFEFTALGFTASENNQYAFMLEGFEKKWNYVGHQRTATYTNLNPGTYVFRVKGCNDDGLWNEPGTSIIINVLPPWWLTWWFRLLVAVLVLGSALGFYLFRINIIKKQQLLLQQKVNEQTILLVHSNEEEHSARLDAEQARAESEMARQETHLANEQLKLKNKALEEFAYVASHDLQEPLRTTTGFVDLLKQKYQGKLDDRADKYLSFISDATARMKVLISDLLDFSRIGTKGALEMVDTTSVLQNVVADITAAIRESGANIQYADLPAINGYPTEIKLLFQNLLINAIKFRRKEVAPIIKISALQRQICWQFAVSDNGIGIDKQYSERIFDIFQRLHTHTEYAGSGIGLSHCKKIVELHHGKIWMESTPGAGSTFYFTIGENLRPTKKITRL